MSSIYGIYAEPGTLVEPAPRLSDYDNEDDAPIGALPDDVEAGVIVWSNDDPHVIEGTREDIRDLALNILAVLDNEDADRTTRALREAARAAYAAIPTRTGITVPYATPEAAAAARADAEALTDAAAKVDDHALLAWDAAHTAALRAFALAQPGTPWQDAEATIPVPVIRHKEDGTYLTDAAAYDDEADDLPGTDLLDMIPLRFLPAHVGSLDGPSDVYHVNARAAVFGPAHAPTTTTKED